MPDDVPATDSSPGVTRPLRNIYTYGGHPARRNLTVADIQANKAAGVKMTQVSAQTRDEAEVLEALGIDLITSVHRTRQAELQRLLRAIPTRVVLPVCFRPVIYFGAWRSGADRDRFDRVPADCRLISPGGNPSRHCASHSSGTCRTDLHRRVK